MCYQLRHYLFECVQVCLMPCLEEALLEDCRQADHLFAVDMSGLVFVAQLLSAARQSSHDFGHLRSILGSGARKPEELHLEVVTVGIDCQRNMAAAAMDHIAVALHEVFHQPSQSHDMVQIQRRDVYAQ